VAQAVPRPVTGSDEPPSGRQPEKIGGPVAWAVRQMVLANQDAQHAVARHLRMGVNDVAAMEHLFGSPDGLGPADIAHRLGIRSASATALVDRLEEAGYVVRVAHGSDRRRTVVTPTERARTDVVAALRPLVAALDEASAQLTDAERAVVLRFLDDATTRVRAAATALTG
jgi:DNA-binding MarR family transcriptional regulator